jgi:hypothetical protein
MRSMITQDLQPSQMGRRLLALWPLIFVAAVLGGAVGFIVSSALPAQFQATASLGIGADPNLAAPLSPNVQVEARLRIQDLLLSDSTLADARSTLSTELADETLGAFRSRLSLERYGTRWDLMATADSPDAAADIANAWASAGMAQFQQAQAHAIKAGEFQALLFSVACPPGVVVDAGEGDIWVCQEMNLDLQPDQVSQSLMEEARLSKGILPALSITEVGEASPPARPLIRLRASLILAGAVLGLVAGLVLASSGLAYRIFGEPETPGSDSHEPA